MSPLPIDLHGKTFADETEEQTRERVMQRFEDIGLRLLNRRAQATRRPDRAVLSDRGSDATPASSSARRS